MHLHMSLSCFVEAVVPVACGLAHTSMLAHHCCVLHTKVVVQTMNVLTGHALSVLRCTGHQSSCNSQVSGGAQKGSAESPDSSEAGCNTGVCCF